MSIIEDSSDISKFEIKIAANEQEADLKNAFTEASNLSDDMLPKNEPTPFYSEQEFRVK